MPILRVILAAVLGAPAAVLGAPALRAQSYYENGEHGFTFKPPRDWTAVPSPPGERHLLVKYRSPDSQTSKSRSRANAVTYLPDVLVLYFEPEAAVTGKEDGKSEVKASLQRLVGTANSFEDWVKARLAAEPVGEPRSRTINKVPVKQVQLAAKEGSAPVLCTAYSFQGDHKTVTLLFTTLEDHADKLARDFESSARTFKWVEAAAAGEDEAQMSDEERRLQAEIAKLPPGWDHLWSSRRRYLVLFDVEKDFARELAHRLEAMRDFYEEVFPPDAPIEAVSIARICRDRDTYISYGGPAGAGGHWSPHHKELVIFDNKDRGRRFVEAVINHEAFHQYIYYFYGELAPHSWYNEGHGDYFSGARMSASGSKVLKIEPFDWRTGVIQESVRTATYVNLRKFLNYTQAEYYQSGKQSQNYAQGWSIVYFLRNGRQEGSYVDPAWIAMLDEYLENLVKARDEVRGQDDAPLGEAEEVKIQRKAYELTFADWSDDDWRSFEAAWLEFYR